MVSAVTVSGTVYIGDVVLSVATLAVLVAGVVLHEEVTADDSAASARVFLLGGSSSLVRLRFHFWYLRDSGSPASRF